VDYRRDEKYEWDFAKGWKVYRDVDEKLGLQNVVVDDHLSKQEQEQRGCRMNSSAVVVTRDVGFG